MSRWQQIIRSDADRQRAAHWCMKAPDGMRIEFKAAKRTTPQNDRMWAMLTDLSSQLVWYGKQLTPDNWKLVMLDGLMRSLGEVLLIVPNTDGTGFVNLSTSSSDLSKEEMTMLIEVIFKFGAEHGVKFQDEREVA